MPTQNRSAQGKKITEWLKNESVANHSGLGWKFKMSFKNLAIVHERVRDDVEKKMWMKKINKWRITTTTTTKWRSTSQKPTEVLPSKYHRWKFFIFLWLLQLFYDYLWLFVIKKYLLRLLLLWYTSVV